MSVLQDRNSQIIEDYFTKNRSRQSLCVQWGIAPQTLHKILSASPMFKTRPRTGCKTTKIRDLPQISPIHVWIGAELSYMRYIQYGEITATEFGLKLGLSSNRVRLAEEGKYDFTLTDLQRICVLLQVELTELLTMEIVHG